jgi:hypothetical protein
MHFNKFNDSLLSFNVSLKNFEVVSLTVIYLAFSIKFVITSPYLYNVPLKVIHYSFSNFYT